MGLEMTIAGFAAYKDGHDVIQRLNPSSVPVANDYDIRCKVSLCKLTADTLEFILGAYLKKDTNSSSQAVLKVHYNLPPGDEQPPTRGEMRDPSVAHEVQKRQSLRKWENLRLEVKAIVSDVFEVGVAFPALRIQLTICTGHRGLNHMGADLDDRCTELCTLATRRCLGQQHA